MDQRLSRTYGSMDMPLWIDSLSALFIVYLAFTYIEMCLLYQIIYFSIFFINGISSCLAHNPYIATHYPEFNYYMDYLDYLSIIIPLIFSPFIFNYEYVSFDIQIYLFCLNSIYAIIVRMNYSNINLVYILPTVFLSIIFFFFIYFSIYF